MNRNKRVILISSFIALVIILSFILHSKITLPKEPNIILIIVDTLRPDHLGCYGYRRDTSPNVDKFAKDSLLFENCFAQAPNTVSSCSSILTGLLPHETKVFYNEIIFSSRLDTVPEALKGRGYKTLAVISNYVLRKGQGFEQGFDVYDDEMDDRELVRLRPERIADKTTKRAIELFKKHHKNKFFMWIHYQDPHGPYTPPQPFGNMFEYDLGTPLNLDFLPSESGVGGIPHYQRLGNNRSYGFYVSRYDGEIRYFDEHFKDLIKALKDLGLYDNSLIILTADHGEGMGERNYFFAHGKYVYNNLVHVPLIIRCGKWLSGRRRNFVQHIDITATIFKAAGIPPKPYFRGQNLIRTGRDAKEIFSVMKEKVTKGYIALHKVEVMRCSIIIDRLKLICETYYDASGEKYLLFDLDKDPGEKKNLIDDAGYQKQAEYLKKRLDAVRNENLLDLAIEAETAQYSEEVKEKLRSLGYAQ